MYKLLTDTGHAHEESASGNAALLDELRKVVAAGVACVEQHDVPCREHNEVAAK